MILVGFKSKLPRNRYGRRDLPALHTNRADSGVFIAVRIEVGRLRHGQIHQAALVGFGLPPLHELQEECGQLEATEGERAEQCGVTEGKYRH